MQDASCTRDNCTDEYDRADDEYPYHPQSDYYNAYNDDTHNHATSQAAYGDTYGDMGEQDTHFQEQTTNTQEFYNLMIPVPEPGKERALATIQHSVTNINLDSYCTRHMMPCYALENAEPCKRTIIVGNKDILLKIHSQK